MPETKKALKDFYPRHLEVLPAIAAAAALLTTGLRLPVLTIRQLWKKNTFSVLSGITALADDKQMGLAALLFFFSIVFPIVKLVSLALLWSVPMTDKVRRRALHVLLLLGKWSMLDVFVVAIIVVAVKMGIWADAVPRPGIYYFAASILLSMLLTSFISHLARKRPTP
jgi:paraquat-inducible protein A